MDDALTAISEAFDERAATYDESTMHRDLAAAVAAFIETEGLDDVLDVATGTGLVLRALAERAPDLHLIGADISPGMLAVARAELPTAEWLVADASRVPIPDGSVDLVTCVTALHIIPDVERAAAEWHRLLRAGGRLVTASFVSTTSTAHAAHPPSSERPYPRDHEPYAGAAVLTATFAALGFVVRRHEEWSDGHDTLLIAELAPAA